MICLLEENHSPIQEFGEIFNFLEIGGKFRGRGQTNGWHLAESHYSLLILDYFYEQMSYKYFYAYYIGRQSLTKKIFWSYCSWQKSFKNAKMWKFWKKSGQADYKVVKNCKTIFHWLFLMQNCFWTLFYIFGIISANYGPIWKKKLKMQLDVGNESYLS